MIKYQDMQECLEKRQMELEKEAKQPPISGIISEATLLKVLEDSWADNAEVYVALKDR